MKIKGRSCTLIVAKDGEFYPLPFSEETVIRPTVIFGQQKRGNVYNLLRQIAGGKFPMVVGEIV